jgi:drug/metabolite transporter (DMT)-like permease
MTAAGKASSPAQEAAASARLLVVLIGLMWGFNWVAARIILEELGPWTLRGIGIGLGTVTLFAAALIRRRGIAVPRGERMKILIAGLFNVVIFNVCSAYAQVFGTTSRAVVIAYSMPIWASLLAWLLLKERFNAVKLIALALCAAGLAILIWPAALVGLPLGALFALGCAWSWAAGSVYLKWAAIRAPTLAVAAWQLLFGALILTAGMLIFEGVPDLLSLPPRTQAWIGYNGVLGMGLTYFLWFVVIVRLPAMTASLGSLLVPVVGVIGSAWLAGERPSTLDIVGFALIFAAAASVLLQPNVKHDELPD